jgi:hypothetical protein
MVGFDFFGEENFGLRYPDSAGQETNTEWMEWWKIEAMGTSSDGD